MPLKKQPKTPRPYLSWTQFSLFLASRDEYYRRYILGQQFSNSAMDFGKIFAEVLSEDRDAEDVVMESLRIMLPDCPKREFKIKTEIAGIPLFGILDRYHPQKRIIREVKTGRGKWTQALVNCNGQLTFYSLLVWLKYKKLPEEIWLDWCPTYKDDNGDIALTGEIKTFKTKRELKDILAFIPAIKRVWAGIQEMKK